MPEKPGDIARISLRELAGLLRPGQLWASLAAIVGMLIGAFIVGERVNEISNASVKAGLEHQVRILESQLQQKTQELESLYEQQVTLVQNVDYPRIGRATLRFGLTVGWQLGRFEFIDGSDFPEAQAIRPEVHGEISRFLTQDSFPHEFGDLDSRELMDTVIGYYGATDLQKHSSILLGLAAFRVSLVGASADISHNREIESLALSVFREIDDSVVPRKMALFESLLRAQSRNVPDLIVLIDTHWQTSGGAN